MLSSICTAATISSNGPPIIFFSWRSIAVQAPEQLIIIGAATPTIVRVVDDINQRAERKTQIVGFLDNAHAALGAVVFGQKVLGAFDAVKAFDPDAVVLINTIAGSIETRVGTTRFFLN